MFKVPDWGNDIPKSNVEVTKLFTNQNKRKKTKNSTSSSNIKNNTIKKIKTNRKKLQRSPDKYVKLSKLDHINNRILKNSLKNVPAEAKHENGDITNRKGKLEGAIKNPQVGNIENKMLKRKKNFSKINIPNKKRNSKEITSAENSPDVQFNMEEPDRVLVNVKRKKLIDKIKNDDVEDVLFGNKNNKNKKKSNINGVVLSSTVEEMKNDHVACSKKVEKNNKKKEMLKKVLNWDSNRNIIKTDGNKLRMKMMEKLKAAQFRYINEKLYTSSGAESEELFKSDPVAFQTYHEGYRQQVKKWPVNPLDLIVKRIQRMPKTHLIADMGCGEAALSKRVPNKVRSFDLVVMAPGVEACNMAHTPLLAASMDVVVFCLALMGTDLTQYLLEANRVLKIGGHLLIAEVESRFENAETFSSDVQRLGFSLKKMDKSHKMFFFMEFSKMRDAPTKKHKLPMLSLKPCLYKKR